jgi:hypothetical protein
VGSLFLATEATEAGVLWTCSSMVGRDELVAEPENSHALLQLKGEPTVSGDGGELLRSDIVALFNLMQGLFAIDLMLPRENLSGTTGWTEERRQLVYT